jgi:hypothetical protein
MCATRRDARPESSYLLDGLLELTPSQGNKPGGPSSQERLSRVPKYPFGHRFDLVGRLPNAVGRTAATTDDGSANFATLKSTRVRGFISRTRFLHLKASVVTQLLLELVEPSVYAKGYVEAMGHSMSPGASGIILFANERAAWR